MATAIEYGLVAALIAVAAIGGAASLGRNTPKAASEPQQVFQTIEVDPGQEAEINISLPLSPRITIAKSGETKFHCPTGYVVEVIRLGSAYCVPS